MKKILALGLVLAFALTFTFAAQAHYQYADDYADATYRGIFADGDSIQVNVQFDIEDNTFTNLRFRHLYYGGQDYYDAEEGTYYELRLQHEEALQYLEGKEISEVDALYNGADVVEERAEVDGFTAATMRSNKIVSAIRDALNRGPYSY